MTPKQAKCEQIDAELDELHDDLEEALECGDDEAVGQIEDRLAQLREQAAELRRT